jgi:hypothetical protein
MWHHFRAGLPRRAKQVKARFRTLRESARRTGEHRPRFFSGRNWQRSGLFALRTANVGAASRWSVEGNSQCSRTDESPIRPSSILRINLRFAGPSPGMLNRSVSFRCRRGANTRRRLSLSRVRCHHRHCGANNKQWNPRASTPRECILATRSHARRKEYHSAVTSSSGKTHPGA